MEGSDDGSVYKLTDDIALIQTVDFFTPIVDDPYMFGQIAAANSLSDVYAMGGNPKTVLNIVAYPIEHLGPQTLGEILKRASDKVKEEIAVIQTVGFFNPIVDDPYMFGEIAAANSLSDVDAMGGTPKTVLNIVAYPIENLGPETLGKILKGPSDKVKEAGALVV